jgi:peptide-methionine (S)-S-oxide reductase
MNIRFSLVLIVASIVAILAYAGTTAGKAADNGAEKKATPAQKPASNGKDAKMEKATFAAGCFWGVEATFRKLEGVTDTAVGYEGGTLPNPTYKDVCTDRTGHAETVEVTYDPAKISYEDLLKVFWENHDPTTTNRQGPDVGTQYRSVVFYHTPEQKAAAQKSKDDLEKARTYKRPIVTQIVPASTFWRAEDYHQQYLEKRGLSTCHVSLSK